MSNKKLSLQELKKVRSQCLQDLADLNAELNIVEASLTNPKQVCLINSLQNHQALTDHIKKLLDIQNKRKIDTEDTNYEKLIILCQIITGVHVNNVECNFKNTLEGKCCYLYIIYAQIDTLECNITYRSNKAPDGYTEEKEMIEEFTITFTKSNLQQEIQDGLDYFSEDPLYYFPNIILFLKSVDKLNNARKNICTNLLLKHKQSLSIVLADDTKHIRIVCKGISRPDYYFLLAWQIKWDFKQYSARDSFKIQSNLTDDKLDTDIKSIFTKITTSSHWVKLSVTQKFNLIDSAVYLFVEHDKYAASTTE